MSSSEPKLSVPREFRRGAGSKDEAESVQRGLRLLDIIAKRHPIEGASILDFGCGVKVAQALVERDSPQKFYAGVDVFADMVNFIKDALKDDPRYHFNVVNFKNDMYNPDGEDLTQATTLPIPDQKYDIMTMFSVVTHLNPDDTRGVLQLLRRYAHDDTTLIFSTFVRPDIEEDFIDEMADRNKPLYRAIYRKAFLEGIIADTGWDVRELNAPIRGAIAAHYVCKVAAS